MSQIFKYHVNGEAKVFELESAPDQSTGWYNSPVDAAEEKSKLEAAIARAEAEKAKAEAEAKAKAEQESKAAKAK